MSTPVPDGGFVIKDTATIADGQSLSGAVVLGNKTLMGVLLPSIGSAAITFAGSVDGSTYVPIYGPTGEYTLPTTTGSVFIAVDPQYFLGMNYIKVRSGTSGSAVAQSGGKSITVISRRVQN